MNAVRAIAKAQPDAAREALDLLAPVAADALVDSSSPVKVCPVAGPLFSAAKALRSFFYEAVSSLPLQLEARNFRISVSIHRRLLRSAPSGGFWRSRVATLRRRLRFSSLRECRGSSQRRRSAGRIAKLDESDDEGAAAGDSA